MDERTLRLLDFPKVLDMVAGRTRFAPGRDRALALRPQGGIGEIRMRLARTGEARSLLERGGEVLAGGLHDIRPAIERARRGGVLDAVSLLQVAETLATASHARDLILRRQQDLPALAALARSIVPFPEIEQEIGRSISPEGTVRDEASGRLRSLRAERRDLGATIRARLEAMLRSPAWRPHLQEPIVTQRQERYVLPVKQESRGQVAGVIHDQSASGATVFLEPAGLVEANNELGRLAIEETREEERILGRISGMIGQETTGLAATVSALAEIDLALACGTLSIDLRASAPELNQEGIFVLEGARHPLLGDAAVPVDIHLGGDCDTLVITGPNTGGKTVCLKTLGLLVLMALAGLYVPADPGSRVAVVAVFADLGDEQSIEQSLSTFSSHMGSIVAITRQAGPDSLVLLDELGAGTDPSEGAALAMALLEFFQAAGVGTVATTHFNELKTFAYTHPRVRNASVEFDPETLAPTYRLITGLPGRSNAFEIAGRLGLDGDIVGRARELVGTRHSDVQSLIAGLEEEKRRWQEARDQAGRELAEAMAAAEEARQVAAERERRARDELGRAKEEARLRLAEVRREAGRVISRIRELAEGAAASPAAALSEAEEIRHGLHDFRRQVDEGLRPAPAVGVEIGPLHAGRRVFITGLGHEGRIIEGPDSDGRLLVQVGAMRVSVSRSDLAPVEEPVGPVGTGAPGTGAPPAGAPPARHHRSQAIAAQKAANVSPELHLRRMTIDEAIPLLEKYLDDAFLAGLDQVRIVHGKGTGTLREAVSAYLSKSSLVESFRIAHLGEGGQGVTVVKLR